MSTNCHRLQSSTISPLFRTAKKQENRKSSGPRLNDLVQSATRFESEVERPPGTTLSPPLLLLLPSFFFFSSNNGESVAKAAPGVTRRWSRARGIVARGEESFRFRLSPRRKIAFDLLRPLTQQFFQQPFTEPRVYETSRSVQAGIRPREGQGLVNASFHQKRSPRNLRFYNRAKSFPFFLLDFFFFFSIQKKRLERN